MTLSASQPYVTFGTQASQPGQGGRQAPGGNAPSGQQDGSTPPSMPDGQSGSQPQQHQQPQAKVMQQLHSNHSRVHGCGGHRLCSDGRCRCT